MITHKQLSLSDIFKDCEKLIEEDKPAFLSLLESLIDLDEIVPVSFRNHYHAWTGRPRSYSLDSMLSSSCGRMTYIYPEQDLRAYPGVLRGWYRRMGGNIQDPYGG